MATVTRAREWILAPLAALLLAAAMTWPTLRHPLDTLPKDLVDPSLQAWQIAWDGHALLHHPLGVWQANTFYPEHYSLAFSDSLLGYAPFGLIGSGPSAAVLRYNLIFVLAAALAWFGVYALARQLGARVLGSAVAGTAFAYAPWRFSHAGHLNILSDGGIALALAMLARGHGWSLTRGYSPREVRPRWAVAGWLVAAWQVSLGFGLGLPFVYLLLLLGVLAVFGLLWRRPPVPVRLIGADLIGGLLFSAVVLVLVHPYLQVLREHPDSRRTTAVLKLYSPPLRGFITADPSSWLWGARQAGMRQALSWPPEMTLLPGFALLTLAAIGLVASIWPVRARLLLAAGVLGSAWLALGTSSPGQGRYGYLVVFDLLPGLDGSRTPTRLVLWTILFLGLLAAGAVSSLAGRPVTPRVVARIRPDPQPGDPRPGDPRPGDPRPGDPVSSGPQTGGLSRREIRARRDQRTLGPIGGLLSVLALAAVVVEGVSHPAHPQVPAAPSALSGVAEPLMVLPSSQLTDPLVMLWSTAGFPLTVNGASGYNPPDQEKLRTTMKTFPDQASVAALRAIGVKSVVVLRAQPADSPYEAALNATGSDLGLLRTDLPHAVLFTL